MARRSTSSATSPRTEAEQIRRDRGLTILELLVVIGIVLALGALALPFTLRELDQRREAEAFDRFGLLCRMARADARASGVPVLLRVDETGAILEARRLDPRSDGVATFVPADPDEDLPLFDGMEEDDSSLVPAPWARLELPDGCRCEPPPDPDAADPFSFPGDMSDEFVEAFDDDAPSDGQPSPWETATRIVLFLPDGAAVSTRPFGVRTRAGWRPVEIEPYGGRPLIGDVFDPEADDFVLEDPDIDDMDAEMDWEGDWQQAPDADRDAGDASVRGGGGPE